MKISDELIACYVEGNVTAEEQNFVRKYLCEHPEEYEHILCLMDEDTEDYLNEYSEDSYEIIPFESSFSDIACSAAAFAPQQKRVPSKKELKLLRMEEFYDRLDILREELMNNI